MILKMRVRDRSGTCDHLPGQWVYVDRVSKAQSFRIEGSEEDGDFVHAIGRVFRSQAELSEWVDKAWGPMDIRSFEDELWPQLGGDAAQCVIPVRLERSDGTMVLALLADQAFLLSDEGHTVDRLYP